MFQTLCLHSEFEGPLHTQPSWTSIGTCVRVRHGLYPTQRICVSGSDITNDTARVMCSRYVSETETRVQPKCVSEFYNRIFVCSSCGEIITFSFFDFFIAFVASRVTYSCARAELGEIRFPLYLNNNSLSITIIIAPLSLPLSLVVFYSNSLIFNFTFTGIRDAGCWVTGFRVRVSGKLQ